jgi:predicted transposase YbfD/YdcC
MAAVTLSFRQHFANLQDPRPHLSRTRYRLLDLVFIALCATIAGANDWHQIEAFAKRRRSWLEKFCHFEDDNTPSHDTFERVFKSLKPQQFNRCFARWTAALAQGLGLKQIAIDGKTMRGSACPGKGLRALHLVSAWSTANHLSLGQVAVDEKSNEITAIPELLKLLDLEGALVSIDAMGCQKKIAQEVVDGGGDYLLVVKDNQENLLADIRAAFCLAFETEFVGLSVSTYETKEKGHGREEQRCYTVLHDPEGIRHKDAWAKLNAIGMCTNVRTVNGQTSEEAHYFILSRRATAQVAGKALRGHWGIENNLHWQLDVTFGEDANHVEDRNAAENLSSLRRLALALLKRHPSKKSIQNKRYTATLDVAFLEEILLVG